MVFRDCPSSILICSSNHFMSNNFYSMNPREFFGFKGLTLGVEGVGVLRIQFMLGTSPRRSPAACGK